MKCDHQSCPGHLGKFQSCLAEAVWALSLDGFDEDTGTTEFEGHYTLMHFPEPVTTTEGNPDVEVTIPAGHYIVESTNSGAVYLLTFATAADADNFFAERERAYMAWDDTDD